MHVTKIEHTERDLLEKEDMVANLVMLQQHGENLEQGLCLWCRRFTSFLKQSANPLRAYLDGAYAV